MSSSDHSPSSAKYDPVFLHSRREAIIIFSAWLIAFVWAVPFCYLTGYVEVLDPATFSTTWGIPTWLFWGIFMPWIAANVFTAWFCFFYMKNDDLGELPESMDGQEDLGNPADLTKETDQ